LRTPSVGTIEAFLHQHRWIRRSDCASIRGVLDPRRLRMLVALSEHGTIAAAAAALDYTASTVSHALSTLEADLGVALLERGPRSVRMTAAGRELALRGRRLLADLNAAEADVRGLHESGPVTVTAFPSAAVALVAPVLAERRFAAKLLDAEPDEALSQLRSGVTDVAVLYEYGYGVAPLNLDGLVIRELGHDPICVCRPEGAASAALPALAELPFVAGRVGTPCHAFTRAACRRAGFEPVIAFETNDIAVTCALVDAGRAAAVMARALLDTGPWSGRSLPASDLPARRLLAATRSSLAGIPAVAATVEALTAQAERRGFMAAGQAA
jgi:DNA-binding transcriptional LysR family regulator